MRPNILVCTPMYGGMCTGEFSRSMLHAPITMMSNGIDVSFSYVFNDSLVQSARNTLANVFVSNEQFTHLLFVDADIRFNAADILDMIRADKDIIGGVYPMKMINWANVGAAARAGVADENLKYQTANLVINLLEQEIQEVKLTEPVEVSAVGTGFMLITREVFMGLKDKVETYINGEGNLVEEFFFLSKDPVTQRQLPEDYTFCYLAREHGFRVFAAPWVRLAHVGTYTFEGSLA